jgi:hypothetical protein
VPASLAAVGVKTAYTLTTITTDRSRFIFIWLKSMIERPQIAAIEIIQTGSAVALPTHAPIVATTAVSVVTTPTGDLEVPNFIVRINCVSFAPYIDTNGNTWLADSFFESGNTFSSCPVFIIGTHEDLMFCTERWGALIYKSE